MRATQRSVGCSPLYEQSLVGIRIEGTIESYLRTVSVRLNIPIYVHMNEHPIMYIHIYIYNMKVPRDPQGAGWCREEMGGSHEWGPFLLGAFHNIGPLHEEVPKRGLGFRV